MAAHSTTRPTWQSDACPSWCVVEHAEDDPPANRVHDSAGSYLPVTLTSGSLRGSTPTELLLVLSRRCDEVHDWVFVGEVEAGGQHLVLSRDSAALVASAVTALLGP